MQWWAYMAVALGSAIAALAAVAGWQAWHWRRQARATTQALETVLRGSGDAIFLEDDQGRITHWSPGAQALLGYSAKEMLGQTRHRLVLPEQVQHDTQLIQSSDPKPQSAMSTRRSKSGANVPVMVTYTALHDAQGKRSGLCCVMRDTHRQNLAEELIRSMSFNDALTGLPNWRLLRDRLWRAQLNSGRQRSFFAVLYVDLDDFKTVNHSHGHDAGDLLLVEVAARLMAAVRQKDTVARLAGDEFVVLLEDLGTDEFHANNHANAVADKVLDLMEARTFRLGDVQVQCSASIGIQVVQGGNGHVDQLIKQADAAMTRVKEGRRMVARGDYAGKTSG